MGSKRHAPATLRNRDALADVLSRELPMTGLVLEVASGTGEHAVHFASSFPQLDWQPSDLDPQSLASIKAWRADCGRSNLRAPVTLDAAASSWPIQRADAILCVNMVHISPWTATRGLFEGAGRLLALGDPLILYGPFLEAGRETAPSNLAFHANLRARDPEWGLREIAELDAMGQRHGLERSARYEMPANNLSIVYRRA